MLCLLGGIGINEGTLTCCQDKGWSVLALTCRFSIWQSLVQCCQIAKMQICHQEAEKVSSSTEASNSTASSLRDNCSNFPLFVVRFLSFRKMFLVVCVSYSPLLRHLRWPISERERCSPSFLSQSDRPFSVKTFNIFCNLPLFCSPLRLWTLQFFVASDVSVNITRQCHWDLNCATFMGAVRVLFILWRYIRSQIKIKKVDIWTGGYPTTFIQV